MLLTKTVKVKITSPYVKKYQALGYDCKVGDEIDVKVEDLSSGNHAKVEVLCDYCKENISVKQYSAYLNARKYVKKDCCKKCQSLKTKEVNLLRFGVESKTVLSEVQEKIKNTNMERYGCENPFANKEVKEKIRETNIKKYGVPIPTQNKEIQEKSKNTVRERYGVDSVMLVEEFKKKQQETLESRYGVKVPYLNEEIKKKGQQTCLERYGATTPFGNHEIWQKAHDNSTHVIVSSQQLYLYKLYGGELNYPLGYFYIDIFFKKQKICFEYDGSGHKLSVKIGSETEEYFNRKEVIKYQTCIRAGYKQFKIINEKTDILPSDEILLNMKRIAFYFLNHTDYNYIWFYPEKNLIKIHGKDIEWDFKTKLKRNFYLD